MNQIYVWELKEGQKFLEKYAGRYVDCIALENAKHDTESIDDLWTCKVRCMGEVIRFSQSKKYPNYGPKLFSS